MNSFLDEAQDAIVTDPERISISCLNQLQKISNSQNPAHVDQEFPNLPELNEAQVRDTQRFLSSNRALTEDGFSDAWIRRTQNTALISNLWRKDTILKLKKSFQARLVPLNKVWPSIPRFDQFRPIIILSPMIKFIELRFYRKLLNYLKWDLDKNQIGFVPNCSTQMNIKQVVQRIQTSTKQDKVNCIFIDFSSAYNTIDR